MIIRSADIEGCASFLFEYFIVLGRVTSPSAKPPILGGPVCLSYGLSGLGRPTRNTTRDMTRLEVAEMRFLRNVEGYTRLDKIRSEVIRKELEISGIQDVKSKHKQNWINHLERMDNTRLPKHALNYKPRGRRDRGRPKKRWQRVDAGTGQST